MSQLARILGILVGLLAWTGAAFAFYANGEVQWRLIAAGVFFMVVPFLLPARPK